MVASKSNLSNFMPVLGLVLVLVIVSMIFVNLLGLNLSDNSGLPILNRLAIFEGMKGKNKNNQDKQHDIEASISSLMETQLDN
jgi:hypothetical protein|tara:strand:- start:453 stop:701 length:249 start_codon:yes stop_codon:yes gene_type:complete